MAASQFVFVAVAFYMYFLSSTNAKLLFLKQHHDDKWVKVTRKHIFGEEEGMESFSGLFHIYSLLSPTVTLHNKNVIHSKLKHKRCIVLYCIVLYCIVLYCDHPNAI